MTADIVLMDSPLSFEKMWKSKEERTVDGVTVNIVSIDDLILLKQYANRKQDQDDVFLLSKLLKK